MTDAVMICENTISSGFYFMMGKFLFDLAVLGVSVCALVIFALVMAWLSRSKK